MRRRSSREHGKDRTLWLFGDTFVATTGAHLRSESKMVRNTVGVQTGLDPRIGPMAFHWRRTSEGAPASFFAEDGERWWWPGHGLRIIPAPTVFRPPESDGPRPFVYAAKAHPELVGPATGDLVVTYATNSFEFGDLFSATGSKSLYWPRLVAVRR